MKFYKDNGGVYARLDDGLVRYFQNENGEITSVPVSTEQAQRDTEIDALEAIELMRQSTSTMAVAFRIFGFMRPEPDTTKEKP